MILHPLLGAASESGDATFFEDYGTLLASFVALAGALATLLVSGRRAARDSRITREDAYRDDTRRKVADLLAAATLYERHGRVASDPSRWLDAGQDKAAEFAGYSEQALSRLEAALVLAQLTALDAGLQKSLQRLEQEMAGVSEVVQEVTSSFWQQRRPKSIVGQRDERWSRYRDAYRDVRAVALQELRPTVRERERRVRPAPLGRGDVTRR